MPAKSITLAEKITARFVPDSDLMDVSALIKTTKSPNRFDSLDDFKAHLAEGALLNVSVLGSKALSVPCGEYMVWMTDMGHTMLVPTTSKPGPKEVFEQNRDQYEIQTKDLLKNWNRLERTIAEDNMQGMQNLQQGGNNEENLEEPEDGDPEEGRAGEFRNTIDMSTVDRPTIARAMTDRGYTVTSLANEVGVQAPAISRILRTPEQTQGDPGGRNPSIGLASEICRVLRLDPTVAFPDIFSPQTRYEPRQSRTSSPTESIDDTLAYLDCIPIIEGIATQGFANFWNSRIIPAIRSINTKTTLNEFIVAVRKQSINEETGVDWASIVNSPPTAKPPRPKMPPVAKPPAAKPAVPSAEDPRVKAAINKMNMAIMPELKKSFAQAMKTLKEQLQQAQYKIGANPKIAPHAWEIMNRFYKTVMQAGMNYEPKWNASAKGSTPAYMGSFQQASANANKAQGSAVANSLLGRDG